MKTTSTTDFRKNLAKIMDQVNEDHEPIIVTRSNGKPAVLISLEDYSAMDETTYLLSSPANRKALLDSISQIDKGETIDAELLDELPNG
ncbi:MAG: type II toxin-antitoxin system prevent-host-death family antitoxin [Robiginitomaculum sp.]|nr:MAG: type II toxin-antitoxin system prevent-host-death family antitoxin [Robiginitomaculum sp.]